MSFGKFYKAGYNYYLKVEKKFSICKKSAIMFDGINGWFLGLGLAASLVSKIYR
jgi:hypothetical protein